MTAAGRAGLPAGDAPALGYKRRRLRRFRRNFPERSVERLRSGGCPSCAQQRAPSRSPTPASAPSPVSFSLRASPRTKAGAVGCAGKPDGAAVGRRLAPRGREGCRFLYPRFSFWRAGGGTPATLAGAQRVGPRPFLELSPRPIYLARGLQGPAASVFPSARARWRAGGGGGGGGGGRPCAHAQKELGGEGLREEPGGGCGVRFSGLSSFALLSAGLFPPLSSWVGGERKEPLTVGIECRGKPNNV